MTWTLQDAKALKGATVLDPEGRHVGRIEDVYLDRHTGEVEWATVRTGLFGRKVSFAPIADAHPNPAGDVVVDVTKDQIQHAPRIEPDDVLTPEDERRLYAHYGRSDYDDWRGEDRTQDMEDLPAEPAPSPAVAGSGAAPVIVVLRRLVVEMPPDAPSGAPAA